MLVCVGVCGAYGHAVSVVSRTHVDPVVVQKREEAVLAARERMQRLAERNSVMAEEKQREIEEEKQRRKAEEWEHHRMFGQGINNKSKAAENKPVGPKLHMLLVVPCRAA